MKYFVFLRSKRKSVDGSTTLSFTFLITIKPKSFHICSLRLFQILWSEILVKVVLYWFCEQTPFRTKSFCISLLGENTPINSQFNSLGKSLKGNFVFSIFLINSLENFGFHSRWTNILFDNDWWWWVSISEIPSMPSLGDGMFYLWGDLEGSPEVPISRSNWTTFYQRLISQDFAIQTPMQVFIFPKWLHFLGKARMRVFFCWLGSVHQASGPLSVSFLFRGSAKHARLSGIPV